MAARMQFALDTYRRLTAATPPTNAEQDRIADFVGAVHELRATPPASVKEAFMAGWDAHAIATPALDPPTRVDHAGHQWHHSDCPDCATESSR